VLHQVGAGALGPVFRAFDPERDRLVAVKRFQLDVTPERAHELVALFERLVSANLSHPAVAAPVAAGLDGTAAYLATEYASGDSLDIAVRDYGPAPPADALRVATQLAGALDFAAVVNIAHGALHPRDVLLSSEDTHLTGLGVARALESIGVVVPARRPYAAPERISGDAWDRRADVFSLAALIHELLWARRIGGIGSRAADALTEIGGGDLHALRDVFARALAEVPADRFGTALEFADALKAALPYVAASSGPSVPGKRPRRQIALGQAPRAEPVLPLGEIEMPLAAASAVPPALDVVNADAASDRPPALATDHHDDPGELDLREAEAARYQDVESAPSIASTPPIVRAVREHDFVDTRPEFMASALEQSRSAVWPLVLALIVGVAIGFAGGYGVGARDRSSPAPGTVASTQALGSSGHDSTEVAVADPQKSAAVGSSGGDETPAAAATAASPPAMVDKSPAAERPAMSEKTNALKPEAAKPAPPKITTQTAEPESGRLLVRSTPAGARVFVDGHEYGKTPVAVRELSRGAHRVRVVREGYATEERRIALTASRPAQAITVALERDRAQVAQARRPAGELRPETPGTTGRFAGPLTVESRPTGAHVYLDGKLVGTTPLQLPEVVAGEHAIRLEHDGFRLWTSSVRVIATERNRVTASLER
jgi:hypothetical protein